MNYSQLYDVALYLYKILDNIDTASDMAKGDDSGYRELVEKIQSAKSDVVSYNDGQKIVFKPLTGSSRSKE